VPAMPFLTRRSATTSGLFLLLCASLIAQQPQYPQTRKGDQVDEYHGVKVADPYRWLEDDNSRETAAWVEAENKVTFAYLDRIPFRKSLTERVITLNDYERISAPFRKGPYVFFTKNEGTQNQSVLYVQKGMHGTPEVLLDPNSWSKNGTTRLGAFAPSKDAKYAVYGVSASGSDWQTYKVMELAPKQTLSDSIEWVKVSGVAWQGDGFYYSRYPEPAQGKEKASINQFHRVFFHKVGTAQSQDTVVYEDEANPQRFHTLETTEDERFAILSVDDRGKGKDGNALFVRDLAAGQTTFSPLIPDITDDTFSVLDNVDDKLLVRTNHKAPNQRVVLIDPKRPAEAEWKTILPERPEALQSAGTGGGKLFATYLKDVTTTAQVFSLAGKLEHEITLPGLGIASGFVGNRRDTDVFYSFNSLITPPTIYRYDIATATSSVSWQPNVPGYDPSRYETKRVFYPSKDGTKVPMFLVHKKGLKLDGVESHAALRVRRVQHRAVTDVQRRAAGAARAGIRLCEREFARRRRVRRSVAQGRDEAEQAERVR
jgi:prolyl oligopeptidase